ncbi:MAG: uroporphyrinogen-III synthase [Bacteroidota bacterium]
MRRIFVSRYLAAESPLRKWATENDFALQAESLLHFEPIPFHLPAESFDWVFFYSPRAVEFFYANCGELMFRSRLAAMGQGTANMLLKLGYEVAFIGNGSPEEVAVAFGQVAENHKVLFPRAEQSRRSVERYLEGRIKAVDLIVYRNEAKSPQGLKPSEIVVLTSPLNVAAYLAVCPAEPQIKFFAIGPSTAEALAKNGILAPYPAQPNEWAMVRLLDQWLR